MLIKGVQGKLINSWKLNCHFRSHKMITNLTTFIFIYQYKVVFLAKKKEQIRMKEKEAENENQTEDKVKKHKAKSSASEALFEKNFTNEADVEDWIQKNCSRKIYQLHDKAFVCRKKASGCTSRITIYQDAKPGGINHFRAKGSFFHSHDEPTPTNEYLLSNPWQGWFIDKILSEDEKEFAKKRRKRLEAREDVKIECKEEVTMPTTKKLKGAHVEIDYDVMSEELMQAFEKLQWKETGNEDEEIPTPESYKIFQKTTIQLYEKLPVFQAQDPRHHVYSDFDEIAQSYVNRLPAGPNDYTAVTTVGDGDCLWHSHSMALNGTLKQSQEMKVRSALTFIKYKDSIVAHFCKVNEIDTSRNSDNWRIMKKMIFPKQWSGMYSVQALALSTSSVITLKYPWDGPIVNRFNRSYFPIETPKYNSTILLASTTELKYWLQKGTFHPNHFIMLANADRGHDPMVHDVEKDKKDINKDTDQAKFELPGKLQNITS